MRTRRRRRCVSPPSSWRPGADVHRVFQGVYENVAFAKLKLVARALENAEVFEGGRVVVSHLEREDFDAAGAESPTPRGSSITCAPWKEPSSRR
jgi:hypothetical protein